MKKTGKRFIHTVFICIIFLTAVYNAAAKERILSIHAEVNAAKIGILDTIDLTVTVETENITRLPNPELPDLKFFNILNESTKSQTSISMVNGKTTRTKTVAFTYLLQPKNKGTFTIDPISIKYKGEEFKTYPIAIEVVEGHVKSETPGYLLDEDTQVDIEKLKEDILILVKPEKSTIFEGQQLLLTYTLYSRLDIDSIALKDSPEFPGFYKEDIFNATRLEYRKETYEGRLYKATLLKKIALFPIKPGTFSPKPLVLETTIILKSDDLFSFLTRPYTFFIQSNELSIIIKSLPENKTGVQFTHIVGDLSVDISKRENTTNTGESTTCYLTLKGSGNLNSITDPGIQLSKRGRVYLSETITDKIEKNDKIYFIKKFEYTIIPEESGVLAISAENFLYYDVNQDNYSTASAKPVQIKITGKDIYQEKPIIGTKKTYSEGGFNFIKRNVKDLKNVSSAPFKSPYYYFYHIIQLAVTGILFFIKIKREKLEKNENLFKKKKARPYAMEILKEAGQLITEKNYTRSIDLINQALSTYIAYKCCKRPQEITVKNIHNILGGCLSAPDNTKRDIAGIMEQCTMLKFSRENKNEMQGIEKLYEKTLSSIDEVESYNRRARPAHQQKPNRQDI